MRAALVAGLAAAVVVAVGATSLARLAPAAPVGSGRAVGGEGGRLGLPGWTQPEPVRAFLTRVGVAQRRLNQGLSRELRAVREGRGGGALLGVAGLAFLYGVLHAVGPGHGKFVVSSLFLARRARLARAIATAGAISLLQALSAIALVLVVTLALGRPGLAVLTESRQVELVSYALIGLIGVGMVGHTLREVLGRRHEEAAARPAGVPRSLVVAAGLTPCSSAVIVLLFALAHDVLLLGIGAALVMAVGMGATVSLVGLAALLTRRTLVAGARRAPRVASWVERGLALAGGGTIAVLGLVLFLSAWSQAP